MKKEKLQIAFNLVKIEEKQFSIFDNGLGKDLINQKIGVGFNVEIENNIIASAIHFLLEVNEKPFINIEVVCYFELATKDFQKLNKSKNIIEIPSSFAQHLASITTGTTRGILFANTKDTPHNSYYIGLLDLTKVIETDIIIEI